MMMAAVSRGAVSCLRRSSSCDRYRYIADQYPHSEDVTTSPDCADRSADAEGRREGKATHAVESVLDELIVRGRVRETHLVPVGIRGRENARL